MMSDHIYKAARRRMMDQLDETVKKAQVDTVLLNKGSDIELALNPATLKEMMKEFGVPDVHLAHDGKQNASYQGIPIRESDLIPPGKAFVVDRGAQIRGAEATEIVYDEAANVIQRGDARVKVKDATGAWEDLGTASVAATEQFNAFADAALSVSGRMLPPPEWQDRAVRAAQAAGMDLEWCQQVRAAAGKTDTWARVTTRRGGFDVRPAAGESWTQALAAAGIDVPLDAVA